MSAVVLSRRPLAANESYIQSIKDRFNDAMPVGGIGGLVYADVSGTLYLEESDDEGLSWSTTTTVNVSAGVTVQLTWTALTKRWYRFRYINGATAQGKFVLIQQTQGMELNNIQLTANSIPDAQAIPAKLTGSKLQVVNLNLDLSTSLAAGPSEVNLVYASTGFLVENLVYAFDCNAPPGATTGTHRLVVEIANSEAVGGRILDIIMPYNANFWLSNGIQVQSGTPSTVYPSTEQVRLQLLSLAAKAVNTTIPLKFIYINNTDVAQTNLRKLRVKKYERAVI